MRRDYAEEVLVLSPIRATHARRQARFVRLLSALRHWDLAQVHVALLASADSAAAVDASLPALRRAGFGSVRVFREPASLAAPDAGAFEADARHYIDRQPGRRAALARARNHLAAVAMTETAEWVLWLDADLLEYAPSLLARLRDTGVELVVPTVYCSGHDGCKGGVYDLNSWRETAASRAELAELPRGVLVVEGYSPSRTAAVAALGPGARDHMDDLRAAADAPVVALDGVGAACILVRADLHRQGLIFPPYVFDHVIESEGLARVAKMMGVQPFGRTDVAVRHA
ncbi:hypothetical protein M885DRAFT_543873 [Pelagophyceae sp. CCMP2097]|nr:hypothetical protein M885DRAFT_543873 [Pelagophyceae sp. CCMP2097]